MALLGFTIGASGFEFFTPAHTNTFNLYAGYLGQMLMTVGAGGIFGLSIMNYSVMPSVTKSLMKTPMTIIQKIACSQTVSLHAPWALTMASLTLMDSFNLFSVGPLILAYGLTVTSAYYKARRLELPLWFSRQLFRYSAVSILTLLLMGYCMLSRDM